MKRLPCILLMLVVTAIPALARPPMSRQAVGRIESVDSSAQRFTFWRAANAGDLVLAWNRRTAIYLDGLKSTPAALKSGQSARVYYRTPFFGPRWASRVVFVTARPLNDFQTRKENQHDKS